MACEVVPTATFEREYDRILGYHVEQLAAPSAAAALIDAVEEACSLLASSPELGAVSRKPLLETLGLREWAVRGYVVVYRVEGRRLFLEHMFHQSQDFELLV